MKFYDLDSIFTFGKYEGQTIAEVYEKDPKYIKYCEENVDEFYVSPRVMKELKHSVRDAAIMDKNLDEMDDDQIADFMNEMEDIEDVDDNEFNEDDDNWDDESKIQIEDIDEEDLENSFEDSFDEEDEYEDDFANDTEIW